MTVSELINYLSGLDRPGAQVLLSVDPEGNRFAQLDEVSDDAFLDNAEFIHATRYESVYNDEEYERDPDSVDVVVLWPK
jgi:hypothetical protein